MSRLPCPWLGYAALYMIRIRCYFLLPYLITNYYNLLITNVLIQATIPANAIRYRLEAFHYGQKEDFIATDIRLKYLIDK